MLDNSNISYISNYITDRHNLLIVFPQGCTKSETTINEYRVAGKKAELRVLAEALLNRGNVVRRNIVAGELVHKPRSEIVLASSRPATPL